LYQPSNHIQRSNHQDPGTSFYELDIVRKIQTSKEYSAVTRTVFQSEHAKQKPAAILSKQASKVRTNQGVLWDVITRIWNEQRAACVEPRQPGGCASTSGSPDKILQQREAGSISTQCSVSNRGRMLKEEDT
jgi:hypothetical protein